MIHSLCVTDIWRKSVILNFLFIIDLSFFSLREVMVFPNVPTSTDWQIGADNGNVSSLVAVKEWVDNLPPIKQTKVIKRSHST